MEGEVLDWTTLSSACYCHWYPFTFSSTHRAIHSQPACFLTSGLSPWSPCTRLSVNKCKIIYIQTQRDSTAETIPAQSHKSEGKNTLWQVNVGAVIWILDRFFLSSLTHSTCLSCVCLVPSDWGGLDLYSSLNDSINSGLLAHKPSGALK